MYESVTAVLKYMDPDDKKNYNDFRAMSAYEDTVYDFVFNHREMELNRYQDILKESGISWGWDSMVNADETALDGRTVMALLFAAIRMDRFCDGATSDFFKEGYVKRWLERLRAIDEED